MPNFFAYWDVALIILATILTFAVLAFGAGLAVYMLASSFAPKVLATGAGVIVFAALLFMFYRFLSN